MIGDVLTSSVLFEVIKKKNPQSELHYLINSNTAPVVENNPFIDEVILFSKVLEKDKIKLLKFANEIRKQNYDVVIDVYSKISSNIISLFSGAKTKISYYKFYTTFIYTENIKRKEIGTTKHGLALEHRLQLVQPLGIYDTFPEPKIFLSDSEIEKSRLLLIENGINLNNPLYMISVLGSGPNKTYPLHFMAQVIDTIVKISHGQILFNYIPNQIEEATEIYNLCEPETQKHINSELLGKDLRGFLSITHHCDAVIGNEGGAINMAKALQIKTFAIFSPWIDKATWGTHENPEHINVHIKDYHPELYAGIPEKQMKDQSLNLYNAFKPELFLPKLQSFLIV